MMDFWHRLSSIENDTTYLTAFNNTGYINARKA